LRLPRRNDRSMAVEVRRAIDAHLDQHMPGWRDAGGDAE